MRGREVVEPLVHRLTAEANPIRVDWVNRKAAGLAGSAGRIGMTFLPGKRDEGSAGKHRRDLETDARWLRHAYGLDAMVLLVEDHELELLKVPLLPGVIPAAGIDLVRHPIVDVDVPSDADGFRVLLWDILDRTRTGQNVAVACRGGLGRTGTVVGCLLRELGHDADAAIRLTRATRRKTIETPLQEAFVREWKPARAALSAGWEVGRW